MTSQFFAPISALDSLSDLIAKLQLPLITLGNELRQIKQENSRLKLEIQILKQKSLRDELGQLQQANTHLMVENQALQQQNEILKHEKEDLEKKVALQEPLVRCGLKIRRRFHEHAKEQLGYAASSKQVVWEGNAAAHGGNYLADRAILHLGLSMSLFGNPTEEALAEYDYKALIQDLYGVTQEALERSPTNYESVTTVDFCNAVATMVTHSSYRINQVAVLAECVLFNSHYNEFVRVLSEIHGSLNQPSYMEQQMAYDASNELKSEAMKMKRIAEMMVQVKLRLRLGA
jgi:hypothetical protein